MIRIRTLRSTFTRHHGRLTTKATNNSDPGLYSGMLIFVEVFYQAEIESAYTTTAEEYPENVRGSAKHQTNKFVFRRVLNQELIGRDRQIADPFTCGMKNRIRDGGARTGNSDFANPACAERVDLKVRNVDH